MMLFLNILFKREGNEYKSSLFKFENFTPG